MSADPLLLTIRQALEAACRELGVPGVGYPAPVANAEKHIFAALAACDALAARMAELASRLEEASRGFHNSRVGHRGRWEQCKTYVCVADRAVLSGLPAGEEKP